MTLYIKRQMQVLTDSFELASLQLGRLLGTESLQTPSIAAHAIALLLRSMNSANVQFRSLRSTAVCTLRQAAFIAQLSEELLCLSQVGLLLHRKKGEHLTASVRPSYQEHCSMQRGRTSACKPSNSLQAS